MNEPEYWEVKHIQGKANDSSEEVDFWVVEYRNLGFAMYSEDTAKAAQRVLNAYERMRLTVFDADKIGSEVFQNDVYLPSAKAVAQKQ